MSIYDKEIYNEEQFKEELPNLYLIVSTHFDEKKPMKDFEFSQCLFSGDNIEVYYYLKDNEDYSFILESSVGDEENGKGEFSWD
jgi:hypothetical protein